MYYLTIITICLITIFALCLFYHFKLTIGSFIKKSFKDSLNKLNNFKSDKKFISFVI